LRNHPGQAVEVDDLPIHEAEAVTIRPAQLSDVDDMLRLINGYAAQAIMLPRTEVELCESLRDFLVATVDGELVGCGALHFYTAHMAELRSLAVAPDRTRSGLGQHVAEAILEQARKFGVDVVFAFTYVPRFFEKIGFRIVDRAALPLKAWKDCLRCPMFNACDEIAMAYFVTPGAEVYMSAEPPEQPYVEGPLVMPTLGKPRVLDKPKKGTGKK
jgi:amino-acid N-acetyltransferase